MGSNPGIVGILDGYFSHDKMVKFVWKQPKINNKGAGKAHLKTMWQNVYYFNWIKQMFVADG